MRLTIVIAILGSVVSGIGHAAGPPLRMLVPLPVAPGLDALPRIAVPQSPGQRRINVALAGLDAAVRTAWTSCKANGGKYAEWQRSVEVPMRGPRFLSVVITDDVYCGGLHPNVSVQAVVYDLGTGRPVDWTTLLPPALVGTPTLQQGADAVRIGSKALSALVLPAYRRVQTDPECRRFFAEDLQVMDHSVFSA